MKKLLLISFLIPSLFLASCQNKDEKEDGIKLPEETSVSTSIDYSNDRGNGNYSITSFSPNESISWEQISSSSTTNTQTTEDDNQIILPTKAD